MFLIPDRLDPRPLDALLGDLRRRVNRVASRDSTTCSRAQACLLALATSLPLQPGVDVRAPVAKRASDSDESRPGSFLPPPLEGAHARQQLVGELLLGQAFLGHLPPGRSAGRILSGRRWLVTPDRMVTVFGGP